MDRMDNVKRIHFHVFGQSFENFNCGNDGGG